jgi:hypothetical protein
MTNDEFEQRLRAWYRAEMGEREPAPPALYASLAAIPETMPAKVGSFGGRRGFLVLAAAGLLLTLLIGATIAIGTGLLPPPWTVDEEAPVLVDERPAHSPSAVPGADETEQFFEPFSMVPPNDWEIVDTTDAVVIHPPGAPGARIVVFRTEAATIWGGQEEGYMPWPDDLVAWLEDYPVVTHPAGPGSLDVRFRSDTDITVGGDAAKLIDGSYFFDDTEFGEGMTFISLGPDSLGINAVVFGGGGPFPVQFVVVGERGIAIYHETQSSASESEFLQLLDSIRFTDR